MTKSQSSSWSHKDRQEDQYRPLCGKFQHQYWKFHIVTQLTTFQQISRVESLSCSRHVQMEVRKQTCALCLERKAYQRKSRQVHNLLLLVMCPLRNKCCSACIFMILRSTFIDIFPFLVILLNMDNKKDHVNLLTIYGNSYLYVNYANMVIILIWHL